MTHIIGPVTSEAAVEIAGALPGLARLLITGTVGIDTTHPGLSHLAGVSLDATPSLGIARAAFDRVDVDAWDGGGWTPVFSRHEHQGSAACVLLPGVLNLCGRCLTDVLFILRPPLDEPELDGLIALVVALDLTAPLHPIAGINLDDLTHAIWQASDRP